MRAGWIGIRSRVETTFSFAGSKLILRPSVIPLAEQLRRRSAEPQRLVQLQHGIPTFARQSEGRFMGQVNRATVGRPISPKQPEGHGSPITVISIMRRRGLMSHSR